MGRRQSLDRSHVTIAEFLRRQGYRTGAVGSAWISRTYGFDYGFEDFVEQWRRPSWGNLRFFFDRAVRRGYDRITRSSDGGDYAALQWFKRWVDQVHREGPFFGFMRFLSIHAPYAPPPRHRRILEPTLTSADDPERLRFLADKGRFAFMAGDTEINEREWEILKAWYDACILYVDELIGQLIRWLERRRLLDSTLLIITSDHGENFGEHGLADHQYCIYDTLLRVPLIIAGPKEILPKGNTVSSLVSLVDLFPFIAQVIGAQDLLPGDLAGGSFFPIESAPFRDAVFAEYGPPYNFKIFERLHPNFSPAKFNRALKAIRTVSHKYILASDGSRELYDVCTDPGEEANIVTESPGLAERLHDQLEATLGGFSSMASPDLSSAYTEDEEAELTAHLRSLGYL
jgi:arylsulfatase A-like enzyme